MGGSETGRPALYSLRRHQLKQQRLREKAKTKNCCATQGPGENLEQRQGDKGASGQRLSVGSCDSTKEHRADLAEQCMHPGKANGRYSKYR